MSTSTVQQLSAPSTASPRDLSIDYLRTTLTLMVLGHHSSLAYTTFARFDRVDLSRSTAPVVDTARWIFLDYAENFNDVFFMSLMFFVSGLFVYPALRRHGTLGFIRDRVVRLGVPFAFAVLFLMPIAYFVQWQLAGRTEGFLDFYRVLAARGFAVGPPWFIWVLLFFDCVLALLLLPLGRYLQSAGKLMRPLQEHPLRAAATLFVLASAVYIPMMYAYGFGKWVNFITSPFSFQVCRIGLYALWFVFGFLVGVPDFTEGLLARTGSLARYWRLWIVGTILAYNALYFVPKLSIVHQLSSPDRKLLEAFLWVASCVVSCFGFLALFRGRHFERSPWMDSLARCAYIMYLVHYVLITWTQRMVLDVPIAAGFKFLLVFVSTTLGSWAVAVMLLRIPGLKRIL